MPLKQYPALVVRDEGGSANVAFGVVFPDLPGCTSMGDTAAQAEANGAEALALHIEGMIEDGEPIPPPSAPGHVPEWLAALDGNEIVAHITVPVEIPARAQRAAG